MWAKAGAVAALTAMAGGLSAVDAEQPTRQRQVSENSRMAARGLCRNAAPLPQLPAEVAPQQQQQRYRKGGAGGSDVMVTARRVEDGAKASPSAPPPPPSVVAPSPMTAPPPAYEVAEEPAATDGDARVAGVIAPEHRRYPRPQSGVLTAGEHDDLLNPELYARYVAQSDLAQRIRDLPRLDTERVLTVTVRDARGQPVPFAQVVLTCADGNSLTLASQADGSAVFFPALDRLGSNVSVTVRMNGRTVASPRNVAIAQGAGSQQLGVTIGGSAAPVRRFDLVLAVDTTGSMGDEIRYLQSELRAILADIRRGHPELDLRVGFVFYRDQGDDYVTATYPLSADFGAQQAVLARQEANGGGDYPEAMDEALIRAVGLGWRPDAVKSLVLVADAPPHDDRFGPTWRATEAARARRIHIVPVAASGVADEAEYAMRAMAAATQSRYLFLTDDSGVGNPHAPPAIDCYLVTRLDSMLRRVLDSQLSGRRIEPEKREVIRSVGQYDAGRCVLPPDFRQQS
jgi:hypothetical protein